MPSNASISLTDENTNTVVLTPMGIQGQVSNYKDLTVAADVGRTTAVLKKDESAKLRKSTVQLRVPRLVTETVNSVDQYSAPDFMSVKAEIVTPTTWSTADITKGREHASALLENALVAALVDTGEFVY